VEAARLGGKALWRKYHSDDAFRVLLDSKLKDSTAKGGAISLKNPSEVGFKARLRDHAPHQIRPLFFDEKGNRLRSTFEVEVANVLGSHDVPYKVEPRFVVGPHAFYPDFLVSGEPKKIIEVVGYMVTGIGKEPQPRSE
jgi:hypothetical protein